MFVEATTYLYTFILWPQNISLLVIYSALEIFMHIIVTDRLDFATLICHSVFRNKPGMALTQRSEQMIQQILNNSNKLSIIVKALNLSKQMSWESQQ